MLRSCYTADVRFFHDSKKTRKVIWYFVPDDRPVLPFGHSFGSRIYDHDEAEPAIGERFKPVPWRGGQLPCPESSNGLCGTEEQWQNGLSIHDPVPRAWPGTNIARCCGLPLVGSCGGIAIGRAGVGHCTMDTTFDVYRPFGAALPLSTNNPCSFSDDLRRGRGTSPNNTVAWTHFIDSATGVDVVDGVTRTPALNTLNYADGDEVRIPTGGADRYAVVWVTLCDVEGAVVKRIYLMRS